MSRTQEAVNWLLAESGRTQAAAAALFGLRSQSVVSRALTARLSKTGATRPDGRTKT